MGQIGNWEQELMHDIMYYARGKGCRIKEQELFTMARPIIIAADEKTGRLPRSINALQCHYIFESLKRIVELNKITVDCDSLASHIDWELDSFDFSPPSIGEMRIAGKIKSGEIAIENREILFAKNKCWGVARISLLNLSFLRNLYGLDDGIVKELGDWQENRSKGNIERLMLLAILRSQTESVPLVYLTEETKHLVGKRMSKDDAAVSGVPLIYLA